MNLFRRWQLHHEFRHHFGHHGRGHHFGGHPGHHGHGHGGERIASVLLARVSAKLDLDGAQQERLAELLEQLQRQRRALKALARGPELPALLTGDNFDRDAAQRLIDGQLDQLRAAGPGLVAAFGDFFDALDFEQQQALRFLMRRFSGHGGWDQEGGRGRGRGSRSASSSSQPEA